MNEAIIFSVSLFIPCLLRPFLLERAVITKRTTSLFTKFLSYYSVGACFNRVSRRPNNLSPQKKELIHIDMTAEVEIVSTCVASINKRVIAN